MAVIDISPNAAILQSLLPERTRIFLENKQQYIRLLAKRFSTKMNGYRIKRRLLYERLLAIEGIPPEDISFLKEKKDSAHNKETVIPFEQCDEAIGALGIDD